MTGESFSNFRLAWVQAFGIVWEEGSASAAARRMGCHQTTISRDLANLSAFLKGPVFEEGKLPVTLTPLGEAFFSKAVTLMDWAHECRALNAEVQAQTAAQQAAAARKPRKSLIRRFLGI